MFERIKKNVYRDMKTVMETRYTDGPRDALLHNFLLVEVCDRLEALGRPPAFKQPDEQDMKAIIARALEDHRNGKYPLILARDEPPMPTYCHLQEDQTHDGIMVALFLDDQTAQALVIPGGEDAKDLHITLCYLGKIDELRVSTDRLKEVVEQFVSRMTPLRIAGTTGGIGFFDPSEHSDNLTPMIALVNAHGLQTFQRELVATLMDVGVSTANDFGDYLPHITLAYVDPGQALPLNHLPPSVELTFDTVWLCIGDERIPYKLGVPYETEPTNTQSATPEQNSTTTTYKEEGSGTIGEIPASTGENITASDESGDRLLHSIAESRTPSDDATHEDSPDHVTPEEWKQNLVTAFTQMLHASKDGLSPAHQERLAQDLAELYLHAQHYSYNKAMITIGIKVAQESIVNNVATGIKAFTFALAWEWARKQIASIVATLQEALLNFISKLGDIEIDAQIAQFLADYASWKSLQIANVAWGTGADLGTNAAIDDILDAATNPDLPGLNIDNMRVRVLPEESSGDYCKDYAGQDWSLADYDALGVSWPAHPGCPHYAEIYMDIGDNEL